MALQKSIKQSDGVLTNYHRILFVQSTINSHISISVFSYINEETRHDVSTEEVHPYISCTTYETAYKENMTVEEAYSYLKTLPVFEGAEDV